MWVVVALLLLSGCNAVFGSGGGADSTPEEGVTPAPVPGTTASDPGAAGPAEYPPGVEPRRIVNLPALREAHESVVSDSVTIERTYTSDLRGVTDGTRTVYVENRSTYLTTAGPEGVHITYADPTGRYVRGYDVGPNGVANVSDEVTVSRPRQDAPLVAGFEYLSTGPVEVARVEHRGEVYFRVHTTRKPREYGSSIENFSVTAYVRPDGFVRTVAASYDRRSDGESYHVAERHTYRAVGNTSVTEPDWVTAAKLDQGVVAPPPANRAEGAPPGIGEAGLYNASALWDAHRAVVEGQSYTMVRRPVGDAPDAVVVGRVAVQNATTYVRTIDGAARLYGDPTGTYQRVPIVENASDEYRARTFPPDPYELERTFRHGGGYLTERGSSVERLERNGTTYFRIDVERAPEGSGLDSRNFSATALVRSDGFVERIVLDVTTRIVVGNESADTISDLEFRWVTFQYEFVYESIGSTTVTEPEWVTRTKRNESAGTTDTPEPPEES